MAAGDGPVYPEWLDDAPTPSLICGPDGTVLWANRALVQELGLAPEQLSSAGLRVQELIGGAAPLLEELQARGEVRRREVRVRGAADAPTEMLLSGRRLDRQAGFELTLTDLSPQKAREQALHREKAQLQALVENLPAGLVLVDRLGNVAYLNPGLSNLLQVEGDALLGASYTSLFSQLEQRALEPEATRQALNRAITALGERPTVDIALAEARETYLQIDFFSVWDQQGSQQGWGAAFREVADGQDDVSWKLEMLSILARHLRIPLLRLKEQSSELLSQAEDLSLEQADEFIRTTEPSLEVILNQVERGLELARLELGRVQLRPEAVSPSALIQQAVERAASALGEREIILDLPASLPQVRVDPVRVEAVLFDLLQNAARFSPAAGAIKVAAVGRGPMVELSVTDDGPGVPDEQQADIFETYQSSDPELESPGFSLFLSRRVVEAHGGRIWVESPVAESDHGARFAFTLPRMPESATPISRRLRRASRPTASGRRVWIIEEDPELVAQLRTLLDEAGYQGEAVAADIDVQEIGSSGLPDLVLIDLGVRSRERLALCRALRRQSDLPILVLVSHSSQEDLLAVVDAGADDYVLKPFQHAELMARIHALLQPGEIPGSDGDDEMLNIDGLRIDVDARQVWRNNQPVALTPTEFDLLAYLAQHRGQVLTHSQLVDQVWEPGEGSRHSLFVHISRLRKKLEVDPAHPRLLVTRWGIGYIFKPRR